MLTYLYQSQKYKAVPRSLRVAKARLRCCALLLILLGTLQPVAAEILPLTVDASLHQDSHHSVDQGNGHNDLANHCCDCHASSSAVALSSAYEIIPSCLSEYVSVYPELYDSLGAPPTPPPPK